MTTPTNSIYLLVDLKYGHVECSLVEYEPTTDLIKPLENHEKHYIRRLTLDGWINDEKAEGKESDLMMLTPHIGNGYMSSVTAKRIYQTLKAIESKMDKFRRKWGNITHSQYVKLFCDMFNAEHIIVLSSNAIYGNIRDYLFFDTNEFSRVYRLVYAQYSENNNS